MIQYFVLLTTILGAFSQSTNMNGKVFDFLTETNTTYVKVTPNQPYPFQSFTVCLRAKSQLQRDYCLFSGNNPQQDNDLTIMSKNRTAAPFSVWIGYQEISSKISGNFGERNHYCSTWDSATGVAALWVNGNSVVKTDAKKGYIMQNKLLVILGQDQDSYGGSYETRQSFMGELGDLYVWDCILSADQIQRARCNRLNLPGNVISWDNLNFIMNGNVVINTVFDLIPADCGTTG